MKILLATDGSANANASIELLKNRSFTDALVINVVSVYAARSHNPFEHQLNGEKADAALKFTLAQLDNAFKRAKITRELVEGKPSEKLLEIIQSIKPDMVLIGDNSKPPGARPTLGKVAQEILKKCESSITVVRTDQFGQYKKEKKCLICIDSTITSTDSWLFRKNEFWPSDCDFLILSVVQPPLEPASENPHIDAKLFIERLEKLNTNMLQAIEYQKAFLRGCFPDSSVEGQITESIDVAETILEIAKSWQSDLILTNPHQHSRIDKFLVASVSEDVVKRASCSVEIVR
ncbi:MAG: universal stress protein [Candidatus Saccharibacteria bacterium]